MRVLFCVLAVFCVSRRAECGQVTLVECAQSSTGHNGHCQRAIDGNANQNFGAGSCTHTNDHRGWWRARALHQTQFQQIRIFNRMDCCSNRLNDFSIKIDGHVCTTYRSNAAFSEMTFTCDMVGQLIEIQSHTAEPLTLCEVQAFGEAVTHSTPNKKLSLLGCQQSSTTAEGNCARAIDGNTNPNYGGASCSHTGSERGWWQTSLAGRSQVTHVRIYNRLDCCSERLNNFVITVDGHECASYASGAFFSVETFECNKIGQVVRITNRQETPLTLCEVQVFGVELKKPEPETVQLPLTACQMSSESHNAGCQRAIDGNRDQNFGGGSCTHTKEERSWWLAQTHQLAMISHVRIYNRLDCCSDRLTDFSITVDGHECASYRTQGIFSVETFTCNRVGQVVRINNRRSTPLSLCEVQVFGHYVDMKLPTDQQRLKQCQQSSTTHDGVCQRAMDGNRNQDYGRRSCTHTADENSWWQAHIETTAFVKYVRIYNRLDCCSDRLNNFAVIVGGRECAHYQAGEGAFASVATFECNVFGEVVRIENRKRSPLTLCEVEVYGEREPVK